MKKVIRISEKQLRKLIREQLEETTYQDWREGDDLSVLRNAYDKGKTIGVAFVKKDGSVRHMAMRKYLSSYKASDAPKSEKQLAIKETHNLLKVIDINVYNKSLREKLGGRRRDEVPEEELSQIKSESAKEAWRAIKLENILGFFVGGQFKDLRNENDIMERFGEEVHSSLTKSMINTIADDVQQVQNQDEEQGEDQLQPELNESKKVRLTESQLKNLIRKIISKKFV